MFRKIALGALATVAAAALASSASAATLLVSSVGVYDWDRVHVLGHGDEVSTGIIFNNNLLVFCVDLEHNIGVTNYNPALIFTKGFLTVNGNGDAITESQSNRIGQLTSLARYFLGPVGPQPSTDTIHKLEAVQAAIWSIEYNTTVTSDFADVNGYIQDFLQVQDNGRGYSRSLIAHGPHVSSGVQNMSNGGVPEPATWTMMIGGFGLAGAMLRRRRAAMDAA